MADSLLPPVVAVLTANIAGFKAGMAEAKTSMASLREGDGVGALGAANTALVTLGTAAVGVGAIAVKMAGDFQQATNRLVTSAGESRNSIDSVRSGILDMAGQVGFTAQQLATAMYTVDSAGFHAADSLTIMKAAAQGAKIEQADLGTTTDAVTTALVDYHLSADQAANVMSKLVTAVGEGKTNLQDLAGSLHSVTPLAANLGITFDEVTAAVATMTVHGMSADQATQNLADTIRHLSNPTQTMISEMGQLGLSSQRVSQELGDPSVGLHGVLEQIYSTIMNHMGPAGQVLLGTFKQSAQATTDLSIMLGSMTGQLKDWSNQVVNGSIGTETYKKDIKSLTPELFTLGNQFLTLFDKTTGFSDALKSGSPAAQTFEAALAKIMGDSTGLNTALMLGGENMDRFNTNIEAVKKSTADASGNVKNWADVQDTLNQKLADLEGAASSAAVSLGTKLMPVVTGFLDDLTKKTSGGQSALDQFGSLISGIDGTFRDLTNSINNMPVPKGGLWGLITGQDQGGGFEAFTVSFAQGMDRMLNIAHSGMESLDQELRDASSKANADGIAVGAHFADGVEGTTPQVTDAAGKLVTSLDGPLGLLTNSMYGTGLTTGSNFANGVMNSLPQVDSSAGDLVSHVDGPMGAFLNPAGDHGKQSGASFANGIASTLPLVSSSAGSLTNGARDILNNLPGSAFQEGQGSGQSLANGLLNPLPQVNAAAGGIVSHVTGPLGNLPGSAFGSGSAIANNLAWGMYAQMDHVAAAAAGLAATVRSHLPSSPAKTGPLSGSGSPDILGRNIGLMIAQGIDSSGGLVGNSMSGLLGGMFSRFGYSGLSSSPRSSVGGGVNMSVALYLDSKEMSKAIKKVNLREERVNVNNGQSIRVGIR